MNECIMYIMGAGVLLGGFDYLFGNRFGFGKKFEEGFLLLGPTALSMAGIICLAPSLAALIGPVISPFYRLFGADPAMFASVLALDMGGYPLAMQLADSQQIGAFSGTIVASILGCTMVFVIPVGLAMIKKEDQPYFAKGLMIGLSTLPIACLVGGLMAGLSIKVILINSIPIFILAILLILGLSKKPERMISGFSIFGTVIKKITIFGLMVSAFASITGITLIPGIGDLKEAMVTVVNICIVLLGSLPVAYLLQKRLEKPFCKLGEQIGVNGVSITGMLISFVSTLPVFRMIEEMNPKGKVVCVSFFVSSGAVFGAHLAFCAGSEPSLVSALIVAKLCGAFSALVVSVIIMKKEIQ